MIKAAFFDIDGTLVPLETKHYSEKTKLALQQLRSRGIKTFVATGRAKQEVQRAGLLDGLEFDGYVTANGQYCYDAEGIYFESPIPAEDVKNLYDFLQENPVSCLFMEEDRSYINLVDQRVTEIFDELHTALPPVGDVERILSHKLYQIAVYLPHSEEEKILSLMPGCKATSWHPLELDILPKEGGKMPGILATLERFSLKPEEVMAFGDGKNDRDMISFAGIGVAMGNAAEECKAAADYVTDPAAEEGIYTALQHFGLVE